MSITPGRPVYHLGVETWSDEQILDALEAERCKFTQCDDDVMTILIFLLKARGVYPQETVKGNSSTVEAMVENYGARWHIWRGILTCPRCGSDQRDHEAGPPFLRTFASIVNDRASHYVCPDCQGRFELHESTASSTGIHDPAQS